VNAQLAARLLGEYPECCPVQVTDRSATVARVVVDVMLKPEILDPQGEAVLGALPRLGINDVKKVRIGKRVEIEFEGDGADIEAQAREVADKLLANPVIENFTIERVELTAGDAA
jgi:phosphoribosylformylglycinamidine synthase subunit PurS